MKKTIKDLYDDPISKGFVNHLIRAYLPIYKTKKAWEFEDKKSHNCNVCGHTLIDSNTILSNIYSTNYVKDSLQQMVKEMKGEKIEYEDRAVVKHVTHGAVQAWTGEKTNTYLCADCVKELLDMVTTGILMGDKNITWITKQMQRDQMFSYMTNHPAVKEEEKPKIESIKKHADKQKMTFGDIQTLKDLKERMEKEEENDKNKS